MKILQPKFTILEQAPGMEGMLKQIEIAGRTCYRSEDKITEGSAEKFVERMKSLGHGSVLEHATIYLLIENKWEGFSSIQKLFLNKYTKVVFGEVKNKPCCFVTTNYRVLLQGDYDAWDVATENNFDRNWLDVLQFQCEPTIYHEKRVTVRFNTDIGISREFNRHRVNSISEESTRYCLYSRDKFGGELSVVPPESKRYEAEKVKEECANYSITEDRLFLSLCDMVQKLVEHGEYDGSKQNLTDIDTWYFANLAAQWSYMRLTKVFGWSAQEARSVLPLDTATELVHTAFVSDWENFFKLRCDSHAHPMARELAIPLREEFVKYGLIGNAICM